MSSRDAFHLFFYHLVVGSLKAILRVAGRVEYVSFGKIPEGACVMVANHISHFDPPLLSGYLPRKIDWIAMAELFGASWSKAAFTWLDVIPVDRKGDDRQALRLAIKRLESGRMIGVFPEGGIRDGGRSMLSGGEIRDGAFLLASKANCPVLPVVILGSERLYNHRNWLRWRRARIYIAVGEPVYPSSESSRGASREQLRRDVMDAIEGLKNKLVATCHLTENDLPHSPQERMREP
jgi:1-acyl-sn-glycerol-3-phosphate acyltransferase